FSGRRGSQMSRRRSVEAKYPATVGCASHCSPKSRMVSRASCEGSSSTSAPRNLAVAARGTGGRLFEAELHLFEAADPEDPETRSCVRTQAGDEIDDGAEATPDHVLPA